METFLEKIKKTIKNKPFKVSLPESTDPRIIQASNVILKYSKLSQIFFYASRNRICDVASKLNCNEVLSSERCRFLTSEISRENLSHFLKKKGSKKSLDTSFLDDPEIKALYSAGYELSHGKVDIALAGAASTTADVIRAAKRCVGGASELSGAFVMERGSELYIFNDCGVNIEPSEQEIISSAEAALSLWKQIPSIARSDKKAKVVFLSFSTKGSADHAQTKKMSTVARIFKERNPKVCSDGEMQFDAAIDQRVASVKAPYSPLDGGANIFIFPDLNSGNIAYKIAQKFGSFKAYGPILLGLTKPYSDLSRGASVDEIVASIYINLLRIVK